MKDISFKEYSFVNQPADQKSGVRALKSVDGQSEVPSSEGWVARSNAFVLSMDNEDIFSIAENKSIFSEMKKKESKPIYLQLKGAFLTALSIQENENYKYNDSSLLSDENENIDNCQENSNMDQDTNGDDILAAVQELSDDLSTMSVAKESEVSEETVELEETVVSEETVESEVVVTEADSESTVETAPSEESESKENGSKALPEEVEEIGNQEVDSANSSEAEEDQGKEITGADLTDVNVVSEQDANAKARIQFLEEENKKLKSALHRTLIERVVDTRIGLGFELSDDREKLIEEYATRTASSLADSLRDLAKTPSKFGKRIGEMLNMPAIASEAEVSVKEENVLTIDMEDEPIKASDPKESFEQILVDALMGRRKL
jgi:hypothetical protein